MFNFSTDLFTEIRVIHSVHLHLLFLIATQTHYISSSIVHINSQEVDYTFHFLDYRLVSAAPQDP